MNDSPDVSALAKGLRVLVTAGASGIGRVISADLDVAFVIRWRYAVKGVKPERSARQALFAAQCLGVRGLPEPRFAG